MIVYRVENAEGDGPYTLLDRQLETRPAPTPREKRVNCLLDAQLPADFDAKHPTPGRDFDGIVSIVGLFYACPSAEGLAEWFSGMGDYLHGEGLRVSAYRAPNGTLGRSGLQVGCEIASCRLLSVQPIWWD